MMEQEHSEQGLFEHMLAADPIEQFAKWFEDAQGTSLEQPNAMSLATADSQGRPSTRIVLLKEFDAQGFTFYTNYNSPKGRQLVENPWAELNFFWDPLRRQVRVYGQVTKTGEQDSEAYFHSRPRESQISAWASEQSEVVPDREFLLNARQELSQKYEGKEVPLPPFWGGFRLKPERIEFWQSADYRFHDRFQYSLEGERWSLARLAP